MIIPLLIQRAHRKENIARSRIGLLMINIGWLILIIWLAIQNFNFQFLFQGSFALVDNAFDIAFLIPLLMIGISLLDDILKSFQHCNIEFDKRQFTRQSYKRILGYGILFGATLTFYLLLSFLLSLNNISNNGLSIGINESDLILRASGFIYIGLLVPGGLFVIPQKTHTILF